MVLDVIGIVVTVITKLINKKQVSWVIDMFRRILKNKTPENRIPAEYRPAGSHAIFLNAQCDVYNKGTIRMYTDYAANIAELAKTSEIFTLCVFEPVDICRKLMDCAVEIKKPFENVKDLLDFKENENKKKEFDILTRNCFKHFEAFKEFGENKSRAVYRILLLDEDYFKRNSIEMFELFNELNGNIDCRVLLKPEIEHDYTFLTDYVIFSNEFTADYYDDSGVLILTYCDSDTNAWAALTKLKK